MTDEILTEDGEAAGTTTSDVANFNARKGYRGGVGGNKVTRNNDIYSSKILSEDDVLDPDHFKNMGDKFKSEEPEEGFGKDTIEDGDDIEEILRHDLGDSFDIDRINADTFQFKSKLFNTSFVLDQPSLIQASDTMPNQVDLFPVVNVALSKDSIKEAIRLANLMQNTELDANAVPSPEYIAAKKDAYDLENGIEMPKYVEEAYPLVFKIAKSIFLSKNADYIKNGFRLKEENVIDN